MNVTDVKHYDVKTKGDRISAIVSECLRQGLTYNAQIAYVLATAKHETNQTFEAVREAYWMSESWRKNNFRYWPFYGRGLVQLTWESNYLKYQKITGRPLVDNPDEAMLHDVSLFILVHGFKNGTFTGKKITDYIGGSMVNYLKARQCINGMDRAHDIAAIAKDYYRQLEEGLITPFENGMDKLQPIDSGTSGKIYYVRLVPGVTKSYLKTSTAQSKDLSADAKIEFNSSVAFVAENVEDRGSHKELKLVEPLKGISDWYVFGEHVEIVEDSIDMSPDAPPSPVTPHKSIVVPYFSQRDNKIRPSQTCNMTSAAMVIEAFYPGRHTGSEQLEDKLTRECVAKFGSDGIYFHGNIVKMLAEYGVVSKFSTTTPFSTINEHLDAGLPVIYSGKFTGSGHIITIVDRDSTGYIVNDPWGEYYSTGYEATSGERLHYSYNLIKRVSYGGNNNGWAHLCSKA